MANRQTERNSCTRERFKQKKTGPDCPQVVLLSKQGKLLISAIVLATGKRKCKTRPPDTGGEGKTASLVVGRVWFPAAGPVLHGRAAVAAAGGGEVCIFQGTMGQLNSKQRNGSSKKIVGM